MCGGVRVEKDVWRGEVEKGEGGGRVWRGEGGGVRVEG